MKKIILSVFIVVAFASFSSAQSSEEYSNALKKMFSSAGMEKTYESSIKQMFQMFKMQYKNVDENTWDKFEKEFQVAAKKDLINLLIPVYEKHLTLKDIKEITKFYQTPVGKKFASKTPLITKESMQVGQKWGMKIGQDFAKKMEEEGH